MEEKTLNSQIIYQGSVISLKVDEVSLPDGKKGQREVITHNGGVVIIAITPEQKLVLVEQFRYSIGQKLLEFPAGRLNSLQENPSEAAKRELQEETGYIAGQIKLLSFAYSAPGFCSEKLYFYLATNLQQGLACPDEDEFVNTVLLTKQELSEKIKTGQINDCKTLAGWALLDKV